MIVCLLTWWDVEHSDANVDHIHHLLVSMVLQPHLNFCYFEEIYKIEIKSQQISQIYRTNVVNYLSLMSSFFGVVGDEADMMSSSFFFLSLSHVWLSNQSWIFTLWIKWEIFLSNISFKIDWKSKSGKKMRMNDDKGETLIWISLRTLTEFQQLNGMKISI